jgi:hypothetical protein
LRTASCVQIFRETADIAHDTDKFGRIAMPRRFFAENTARERRGYN